MINIKKCISVFMLFSVAFVAFYFLLKVAKDNHIDELLCEQQKYLEISYKQGLDRFNVIASNVYMSLQNDKEFIKILSSAKEKKIKQVHTALYEHLKDEFFKLQQFGVMGLQIVLPNNISLIRMHRSDKYGDNLSKMRYSLQYVNENKVHISGFEEGKSSQAFREVYPLYNVGKYIGAVEIFFSSTILQDYTMRASSIHTHFIVNKNVFKTTTWKSKITEPYMQSIEHKDFLFSMNDHIKHTRLDISKKTIIAPLRTQIDDGMRSGESFSLYKKLDTTVKVIAFMPVKRIKDSKTVAYLVSYTQSDKIFKILKNFNIQIMVLSVLLILFYFGFCKFLSKKHQMELELQYDDLTNVYNRKYFMSMIEKEFTVLKSSDVNFSLVMVDIDFFKKINDTYGHQCGDTILVELTTILKDSVRSLDKVARYGGEEFIVFLQTDENNAFEIVEKIRKKIEQYEFGEKKLKVTASFGIAGYKNDISSESIIRRADKALYKSKESGRNQTQIL